MTECDRRSSSDLARQIIRQEAGALVKLAETLGHAFDAAVEMILEHPGQLMVTGLGKSGLIGRKIAGTLTSTGTPAVCIHPVEGLHGDLGIVTRDNVLLALSKSGQTDELIRFILCFKQLGGPVIGMTSPSGRLAELCDVVLALPDEPEACPLGLAPTTSTTMQLVLGDAIAMALLEARGFTREDFAQYHPEGHLGRRLLLRASDLMHADADLPVVRVDAGFPDLLAEIDAKHLGMACIVDENGSLMGVFTDGDLRRLLIRGDSPQTCLLSDLMRHSRRGPGEPPVFRSTVRPHTPVVECRNLMEESRITSLVVTDEANRPIGVIRMHDVVRAGIS
ncbi:MAG: KpsF/GutQ family sugar-phosphate isomerase [Phycisphaerae bacterium]|nr:KpsF/GutQ family sugar-phosphate isomerase [Phycisphaerae bacterium]